MIFYTFGAIFLTNYVALSDIKPGTKKSYYIGLFIITLLIFLFTIIGS